MIKKMNQDFPSERDKQKRATHLEILAAARQTIKERGFKGTTIREIASNSQVATGTVMAHFGSKEDLLYEVFYKDIEKIAEDVFASLETSKPLNKQLQFIGETFLRRYADESNLYSDFLEHSLLARGTWGDQFTEQVQNVGMKVAQSYRAAMDRREISSQLNLQAEVMTFFSFYYFVLISQVKNRFANLEQGIEQLRLLVENYYQRIKT